MIVFFVDTFGNWKLQFYVHESPWILSFQFAMNPGYKYTPGTNIKQTFLIIFISECHYERNWEFSKYI